MMNFAGDMFVYCICGSSGCNEFCTETLLCTSGLCLQTVMMWHILVEALCYWLLALSFVTFSLFVSQTWKAGV